MPEMTDRLLSVIEKDADARLARSRTLEANMANAGRTLDAVLAIAPLLLGRQLNGDAPPTTLRESPASFKQDGVEERLKAFARTLRATQIGSIVEFAFTILDPEQARSFAAVFGDINVAETLLRKQGKGHSAAKKAPKRKPKTPKTPKAPKPAPSP